MSALSSQATTIIKTYHECVTSLGPGEAIEQTKSEIPVLCHLHSTLLADGQQILSISSIIIDYIREYVSSMQQNTAGQGEGKVWVMWKQRFEVDEGARHAVIWGQDLVPGRVEVSERSSSRELTVWLVKGTVGWGSWLEHSVVPGMVCGR